MGTIVTGVEWEIQSAIFQAKKKGIIIEFTRANEGGFHRALAYCVYNKERKIPALNVDPIKAIRNAMHTLEHPTPHKEGEQ